MEMWWLDEYRASLLGADVQGSNLASPTVILGRCRIIVWYFQKYQGRGGDLHANEANKDNTKVIITWNTLKN